MTEGEIYTEKGLPASIFTQVTFWVLVLTVVSFYFIYKLNIYVVISLSILNIVLNVILTIGYLGINWLDWNASRPIYTCLIAIIGISALYIICKYNSKYKYLPVILIAILAIIEFVIV